MLVLITRGFFYPHNVFEPVVFDPTFFSHVHDYVLRWHPATYRRQMYQFCYEALRARRRYASTSCLAPAYEALTEYLYLNHRAVYQAAQQSYWALLRSQEVHRV